MGEKFTEQNVFSISDATIAVVSANTSSTYTKGKRITVPELQSMDVTMTKETKDATYGAGKKADSFTILTGLDVKFESVNIPLEVIAAINGATIKTDGATPNAKTVLVDTSTQVPALFNLEFKTDYVNGEAADFHMELPCVKGILDIVSKADDYWTCSFEGTAVERKKDHELRIITANETAVALEDTTSTTPSGTEDTPQE